MMMVALRRVDDVYAKRIFEKLVTMLVEKYKETNK